MSEREPYRRGGSPCPPSFLTGMVGWYTSRAPTRGAPTPGLVGEHRDGWYVVYRQGTHKECPYVCLGWRALRWVVYRQGGHGDPPLRYGSVDNRMTLWPAYLLLPAEVARYPTIPGGV